MILEMKMHTNNQVIIHHKFYDKLLYLSAAGFTLQRLMSCQKQIRMFEGEP